ncbi:carbon-nitrogen hydrolase family protein [Helcococcus massiliensis]|uniref:carbon-nitrogen hydrolase family protein n=1 Tax=Helcococcus massiliensis TaxID=2040290 RepID=UPI000CDF22ED|nr:carbon-nitrogen hydrolase family protein [Helcococcus massiliensis]
MKIALAAVGFVTNDIEYNLGKIKDIVKKYYKEVDLLVFGESFLQGFDCLTWEYLKDTEIALDRESYYIKRIKSLAKEYQVAISFGYIEKDKEKIYSSQLTINKNGEILDNFSRVSIGWKEPIADFHYCEGEGFRQFNYLNKSISIALCGDLWYEENCIQMKELNTDIVLWPVYTDFNFQEWNDTIKYEYAEQAEKCGNKLLYVNSHCLERDSDSIARGGAALFSNGKIESEIPAGEEGVLIVVV